MIKAILSEKVLMPIFDENENALMICGIFKSNARAQGMSKADIEAVLKEARSGDYEYLKGVIAANTILV